MRSISNSDPYSKPLAFCTSATVAFIVLLSATYTPVTRAQCLGVHTAIGTFARAFSDGSGTGQGEPLYDFIGTGGCTYTKFGPNPPDLCNIDRDYSSSNGTFRAVLWAWWIGAPAFNVTENGCQFNCDGGSCIVRGGDGLPVELMDFAIEDDEASATEDAEPESTDTDPSD